MAVKTEFPLVILVLILTSLTQIRSETCTFTRSADTKGLGSGTYIGVKSLEECEQLCVEDSSCVAIYRDPPLCYFAVSTLTESKADATFSSKSCTADTTPEPTTTEPTTPEPTTTEPTTSDTEPFTSEPTSAEPTTHEQTTPDPTTPEPTTLEPTTPELTTPEPTTPEPTTPEPTTPELTTFVPTTPEPTTPDPTTPDPTTPDPTTPEPTTPDPTTPEPTTLDPTTPDPTTPEPTTPQSTTPEPTTPEPTTLDPTTPELTTPESTTPEPTTLEPTTPQPTTPEPTILDPTTPQPTTPEPTILDPTTPEPTAPEQSTIPGDNQKGVCVMIRTEDTTGGNDVYYKLDFSPTSCLGLCQVVDDCQSVTIGRTSCQYYTDVTTPTTILGSIHYVKTQCNDGMKCCWETQTNSASDDTPTFEHDNTLDSCEALCGKLVTCSGVKWSNNECHVYVNHPGLTPESNSIFSKKACSTGGDKGSFKLSSTCSERNGGIQLKTNLLYFLSVLLFLFLFL